MSLILAASENHWNYRLEWLSRDELLMSNSSKFWGVNTNDGTVRSTYERKWDWPYTQDLARAGSLLLVQEVHGSGTRDLTFETELIDLAAGSTREIEPLCVPTLKRIRDQDGEWLGIDDGEWYWEPFGPVAALSADGSQVLYTCPRPLLAENDLEIVEYTGPWESTLMRRDLATGAEAVIGKLEGQVRRIGPAPDGRRFAVSFSDTGGLWFDLRILEEDGPDLLDPGGRRPLRPVDIGSEWRYGRWLDRRRLLLRGYRRLEYGSSQSLAYLDIDEPSEPRRFNLTGEWR